MKYLEVQNLEKKVINLSPRNLKLHKISINYIEGEEQQELAMFDLLLVRATNLPQHLYHIHYDRKGKQ